MRVVGSDPTGRFLAVERFKRIRTPGGLEAGVDDHGLLNVATRKFVASPKPETGEFAGVASVSPGGRWVVYLSAGSGNGRRWHLFTTATRAHRVFRPEGGGSPASISDNGIGVLPENSGLTIFDAKSRAQAFISEGTNRPSGGISADGNYGGARVRRCPVPARPADPQLLSDR